MPKTITIPGDWDEEHYRLVPILWNCMDDRVLGEANLHTETSKIYGDNKRIFEQHVLHADISMYDYVLRTMPKTDIELMRGHVDMTTLHDKSKVLALTLVPKSMSGELDNGA